MEFNINEHPHRRFNPLLNEWILVSPHRAKRPWQGQNETPSTENSVAHDENCYLCAGNTRSNGEQNPQYDACYVFDNDFPALLEDDITFESKLNPLFQIKPEKGINRVICFSPKHNITLAEMDVKEIENVIHTLDNVLKGGHKVLIFSQFVKHLNIFKNCFEKQNIPFAYLDGGTKNRGEIVAEFQENKDLKVFLISIKAGGVGLNLTQADYVFILDPWWNPAVEQQAIDRTHRIGQDKKVFIYKFISKDTVEEKILALQRRKKSLANSLITTEESFFKSLSKEDIREILN